MAALGAVPLALAQGQGPLAGLELEQDLPVALVADNVTYDTEAGRVIAEGNVEVYYGERTLTADKIIYDQNANRIEAAGEIVLRDPAGVTVFASAAELDAELRDGLVRGAQSVIGGTARLSAVEARRFENRYNALSRAVYSPCLVCQENPTPLWRIRARRVVHDEEERIVHYENATLDVFGVPIAWVPYFSHPDPTVDRASGFLVPEPRQSTNYGYGIQIPYYFVIDDQTDATFAPFFTTDSGIVGVGEVRRAFDNGGFEVLGSLVQTDFTGEPGLQGHLDTEGNFTFGNDINWGWDVKFSSDDAYLRFFDFSNEDRLTSELFVNRYSRAGFFDVSAVRFQSLRDFEPAGQIPLVVPDFDARYDLPQDVLGGDLGFFANSQVLLRNTAEDTGRLSVGADWERQWVLPVGLSLSAFGEVRGDVFVIGDNPDTADDTSLRLAPLAGLEARYPLIYDEDDGDAHILEPIAQFIVAPFGGNGPEFVNEDSQQIEFDETNLFDRNHFSGIDGFEEGPRFNLGLRYERITDDGIGLDATIGRVFRFAEAEEFTEGSGLADQQSDFVGAWTVRYEDWASVTQRIRFDDDASVNRNEIYGDLSIGPVDLSAGYIFLNEDPALGTPEDREEVAGRTTIAITRNWGVNGFFQRDLEEQEFVEAGGRITYANECCEVDLFLRRRFTDSDDTPASTSVGVQVRLLTLGNQDNTRRAPSGFGDFGTGRTTTAIKPRTGADN